MRHLSYIKASIKIPLAITILLCTLQSAVRAQKPQTSPRAKQSSRHRSGNLQIEIESHGVFFAGDPIRFRLISRDPQIQSKGIYYCEIYRTHVTKAPEKIGPTEKLSSSHAEDSLQYKFQGTLAKGKYILFVYPKGETKDGKDSARTAFYVGDRTSPTYTPIIKATMLQETQIPIQGLKVSGKIRPRLKTPVTARNTISSVLAGSPFSLTVTTSLCFDPTDPDGAVTISVYQRMPTDPPGGPYTGTLVVTVNADVPISGTSTILPAANGSLILTDNMTTHIIPIEAGSGGIYLYATRTLLQGDMALDASNGGLYGLAISRHEPDPNTGQQVQYYLPFTVHN